MKTLQIQEAQDLIGFAFAWGENGKQVQVLSRATVLSDNPLFYKYVKGISAIFIGPLNVPLERIYAFVVVIHPNKTATIYLNDQAVVQLQVIAKTNVDVGQLMMLDDIADVRRIRLTNVEIGPDDKVAVCMKVGWKFGLYFDLHRENPIDVELLETSLGAMYRRLTFEHVYKTIESEATTQQMLGDGWFPFIEINGSEFDTLSCAYLESQDIDGVVNRLLQKFTSERVARIAERWWRNPVIHENRAILEAGLKAFVEDTDTGNVAAIKILASEIEGIAMRQHFADTGTSRARARTGRDHMIAKGTARAGGTDTLFLPQLMQVYLEKRVYGHFDPAAPPADVNVPLNRHSVAHGAAAPEAYTRARALQMVLVVDQLNFFSTPDIVDRDH